MRLFLSNLIVLILTISNGYSQDPHYINYTIDDGLPSNEVYDVEIDNDGLLWFTTDRGVFTYDSYEFTTYTTHDGLGDNVNFEIFKDSDGVLWFFGYNDKITLYENGEFRLYQYNNELKQLINNIWGDHIKEIQEGENKKIYLSCSRQLTKRIFKLSKDSKPESIISNSPNSLINVDNISFQLNRDTYSHALVPISFKTELLPMVTDIVTTKNIHFLYNDDNDIWYSNNENNRLQKKSLTTKTTEYLLEKFEVTSIRKDYNNEYWASTRNKGILHITNPNIKILNSDLINHFENAKNVLRFHTFSNRLIIGTSSSDVLMIDTENNITPIETNFRKKNININKFQTINQGKTLRVLEHEIEFKNNKVLIKKSKSQKISIVASNNDTIIPIYGNLSVKLQSNFNEPKMFPRINKKITCFVEDDNTKIWIGTLNGIYVINNFDYSNPIPLLLEDGNTLGRINDIIVDHQNNIWICTIGNGVYIKTENDILHFNSDNQLTSNIITTLEVTKDNKIWVATNNGLNLLSYTKSLEDLTFIESFNQSDGLNSNYINDVIEWNKEIYVATPNGISHFLPDKITKPRTEIPININSFLVNDLQVNQDSTLEFQHDQNKIGIKYTAIRHNRNRKQSLYRYSLTKNKEVNIWNYINDRELIFDNLEHGDYTFEVNVANKHGDWNKNSERIQFKILPHFTDTWWFKIALLILSLGVLMLIGLYLLIRYRKRKENELALEEAKTLAKQAEISAIRNQMNPHFIFNSLNSIQNLIFKKDVLGANHYLSKFSTLIRKSLEYSRVDYITIQSELNFIKNYIELEQLRFPNLFEIHYKIDESLDIEIDKIPSLIIQPIIENSIKHGFKNINKNGEIILSMRAIDDNYLEIEITDNGLGATPLVNYNKNKHRSLGLSLISDRIAILQNAYPKSNFKYHNIDPTLGKGLKSILTLPIK